MARRPFEPIGEKSRKDMIADFVEQFEPGSVITYADFEAAGFDVRGKDRSAVAKAKDELLERHRRTLLVQRNVGYTYTTGPTQLAVAKGHVNRSRRAAGRASNTATNIRFEELSRMQTQLAVGIADQGRAVQALFARTSKVEKRQETVERRQGDLERQVTVMRQALQARGIPIPEVQLVKGEVVEEED